MIACFGENIEPKTLPAPPFDVIPNASVQKKGFSTRLESLKSRHIFCECILPQKSVFAWITEYAFSVCDDEMNIFAYSV